MSLRKTATKEAPHATYKAGDWTWHVLKVNAPKKSPKSPTVHSTSVHLSSQRTYGSMGCRRLTYT
jgi:hypothetical protein